MNTQQKIKEVSVLRRDRNRDVSFLKFQDKTHSIIGDTENLRRKGTDLPFFTSSFQREGLCLF